MTLQVGVKVLIHNDEGQYLFLLRAPSFKPGEPQRWDIPGGRINENEPLSDALAREVYEETGTKLLSIDSLLAAQDIFVPEKAQHTVRLTYEGKASGEIRLSDEHTQYRWMTKAEASKQQTDKYLIEVLNPDAEMPESRSVNLTERAALDAEPPNIEPGRYRHYKGKEYDVMGVAAHTETLEPMVVYRPLYEPSGADYWVRPYDMFVGFVIIDGTKKPRFEKI